MDYGSIICTPKIQNVLIARFKNTVLVIKKYSINYSNKNIKIKVKPKQYTDHTYA